VLEASNCKKCRQVYEMPNEETEELAARQDAEAHMKKDEEEDLRQKVRRLERRVDQLEGGMRTISLDFELNEEAVKAIEHLLGEKISREPSGMGFFLSRVLAERIRQNKKWGRQSHRDANPSLLDREIGVTPRRLAEELEICTEHRAKFLCKTAFDRGEGSWSVILVEELAEAVAAVATGDDAGLLQELVQVAAVATAWGESVQARINREVF
jgi:uncharacterized FlaG/YvyC family protein